MPGTSSQSPRHPETGVAPTEPTPLAGGLPPLEPLASERGAGAEQASEDSFFGADDLEDDLDTGPDTRMFERHVVMAVLVSHNGARWLPYVLRALQGLARPPQHILAVDTGSTDASADLLAEGLGTAAVLQVPVGTGFGAAVNHAVEARRGAPGLPSQHDETEGAAVEWLWLLHDDCAPEPETLRALLAAVDASPSLAIVGPKVRGWSDSSRLLEVGVTIGGGGRRETGLERGELDQGQHDHRRDVLAVGTAGMLVRRDVWDALDGFDPRLALFRDDVDLGWRANLAGHRVAVVPEAIIHHIEAAAHGRRTADAVHGHVYRADRRAALHVLLANTPGYALPFHWLWLLIGSTLRMLGLLIAKAPGEAWDEIAASSAVLLLPGPVLRARRARASIRVVPARAVRPLLAPPMSGLRHGFESLGALVGGRSDRSSTGGSGLESGPVDEDAEQISTGPGRLRSLVRRPGFGLAAFLLLVSLVSFRGLLYGSGLLQGGLLYPTGGGSGSLWSQYLAAWHEVGVGSGTSTPPYLVPLSAVSWLLLGKTWLAVDLLLVLAVPLAGTVAYVLLGRLGLGLRTRVAGAVAYAFLPAVTGAVAGGRLGTAVMAWLLPLVGWQAYRAIGVRPDGPPEGSLRRAWTTGLLLAVLVAFVPWSGLLVAAVGIVAVAVFAGRSLGAWFRLGAILVVPPLVLLPWTGHALRQPAVLLGEAGAPTPSVVDPGLPGWHVLLGSPGGPGLPPAWVTLGLVLVALAGLLRADRVRSVLGAWIVVLVGLVGGLAVNGRTVTPESLGRPLAIWPGPATLVLGGGLVVAAALAADGSRDRLSAFRFGWRQPLAALVALLGVLAAPLLLLWWVVQGVTGSGSPLTRDASGELPAYVVASSGVQTRPRALVIDTSLAPTTAGTQAGSVTFTVVPGGGRLLGDAEVSPSAALTEGAAPAVASIVAGRAGTAEVQSLASYGVGFLVVSEPVDPSVALSLDGVPGLSRLGEDASGAVWRVTPAGPRVRVVTVDGRSIPVPVVPGSAVTAVDAPLPTLTRPGTFVATAPGTAPARVVLAEAADQGWRATLDGEPLTPIVVDGWAQGFTLPTDAAQLGQARLTVDFQGNRGSWLVGQLVLLGVVVLLSLPTRRRSGLDVDPGDAGDVAPDVTSGAATPRHQPVGAVDA